MKGLLKPIVSIAFVAALVFSMVGCASMQLVAIESIEGPKQVRQGQDIDPKTIIVMGVYKDDSRKAANVSKSGIIFDTHNPGKQTVTIRVGKQAGTFETEVMALRTLTIGSQPTTALFKQGTDADSKWPGLTIRGDWEGMGSDNIDLSSCKITGFDKDKVGAQAITVAYEGKTVNFNVEVLALTKIDLVAPPSRIEYNVGDEVDLSGIQVKGTYGTGAKTLTDNVPVNQLKVSGFDSSKPADQKVTVAVGAFTATFTIKISNKLVPMVKINPGTFTMGSPEDEKKRNKNEVQHQVTLTKGFYMSKYPITQDQYGTVMGTNPSFFDGNVVADDPGTKYKATPAGEVQGNRPVDSVGWYEAVEFCNKLSEMEKLTPYYVIAGRTPATGYPITAATVTVNANATGYRLPTEAQWEYACRAGTTTATFAGATLPATHAWLGIGLPPTHEVGKKQPNPWGLYDMLGNVGEWCWDWSGNYPEGDQTDPMGPDTGTLKVYRGVGWNFSTDNKRSAYRYQTGPATAQMSVPTGIGFRVVMP